MKSNSNESEIPEKKAKIFCAKTFRSELKGNVALKSLKNFISAAQNSDDTIFEYFENGGSLAEILSLIDVTAKGDFLTAMPVFEAIHLILLRFQSVDSKYHRHCVEAAKNILNSYFLIIQSLFSMNNAKHKKVALKLLTAIVTLNSLFANEVLNLFSPSLTLTEGLIMPASEKESVRKCFIHFVLSFLFEGNLTTLKSVLDTKGFLRLIIPNLKFDESATVIMTLSLMEEKILKSSKISKTLKLKTFNTQVLKSLFDLYDWKGLQPSKDHIMKRKKKLKVVEVNQEEKALVVESVHSFLLLLCTSKKYGVIFSDKSLGTSETTNNQLLLSVFEGLTNPLNDAKTSDIILKSLVCCPDLVKPTLLKLEPFFQPRSSKNWFNAMHFAENLIKQLHVVKLLQENDVLFSENDIIKVSKLLCTPISFIRTVKSGIQKTQSVDVRICSLSLFTTMWEETRKLISAFTKIEISLEKSINDFISRFLPDAEEILELCHFICSEEFLKAFSTNNRSIYLKVTVNMVQIMVQCQAINDLASLASDLLYHINNIKDTINQENLIEIQVQIIHFLEMDLESLSLNTDLFKTSFSILLQTSGESSLLSANRLLSSMNIFENSECEIDAWLLSYAALPKEYKIHAAEYLTGCICEFFKVTPSVIENIVKDMSTDTSFKEKPSPFMLYCLNTINKCSILNECRCRMDDADKIKIIQYYLGCVILKLQHFYPTYMFYDCLEKQTTILTKSIMKFLKCWQTNSLLPANFKVFSCPDERELALWLINKESNTNVKEVLPQNMNISKLLGMFRIVVAYLITKTINDDLIESDIAKFSDVLSFFLNLESSLKHNKSDLVENSSLYHKKCINCLFTNKNLIDYFNIFIKKKNGKFYNSQIMAKVFMENHKLKPLLEQTQLIKHWKQKFLKNLKHKLIRKEIIENIDNFEPVLNYFEYKYSDVDEIIKLLSNVSDLNFFVHKNALSKWTIAFIKFLEIACFNNNVNVESLKKLCALMNFLNGINYFDFDILDNIIVLILSHHPEYLLSIENDFMEVLLQRNFITKSAIKLGKFLLNDPNKVTHFNKIAVQYLESDLVFSFLSTLIIHDNEFFDELRCEGLFPAWTPSEISKENSREFFTLLNKVYLKFKDRIIQTIRDERDDVILNNVTLAQELVKHFMDKTDIKIMKKKIIRGLFHPKLLFGAVLKFNTKEMYEVYLKGLLVKLCNKIENLKDNESFDNNYVSIIEEVTKINKEGTWEGVADSTEWKEFFKLSLGLCLNTSNYSWLIKILNILISAFYPNNEINKTTATYFQMVISHSHFLNVALSRTAVKNELMELYYVLVQRSKSELNKKHIPLLLASYNASMTVTDITILKILNLYEENNFKLSDYEPIVWGEAAISHYSVGKANGLSLWQRFSMANVLDLLDSHRMSNSLVHFPINGSFQSGSKVETDVDENIYDPDFLLPLFVSLLSPGSVVFPLPFIYKGGLAYTIRAFSSGSINTRLIASIILTKFYNHLELNQNLKQKLVWMHFINCFRFEIEDLSAHPVPNITSLFFARMTLELSQPLTEMYTPLQKFLLAKPYFSFNVIPEFLPLFHSSEVNHGKHRTWILQILKDGTKTKEDLKIIFYSMAFKIIFCHFQSELCNNQTKRLILQVLNNLMSVKTAFLLISEYGLLNWISTIDPKSHAAVLIDLLHLLYSATNVVLKDIKINKHSNLSNIFQILNISLRLLPAINSVKSIDAFNIFVKVIFNCSKIFIKREKNDWFVLHRHELQQIVTAGINILGVDCNKFTKVPFYIREHNDEINVIEAVENLKNSVFLFQVLINKI